jgi:type I restriction enzyme R subunit
MAKKELKQEPIEKQLWKAADKLRKNIDAAIDWTIKESVKAKLKVIVKRTLKQYGYPPDMEALATETVLKQAEMIADELQLT